eukprot:TRINITY_DN8784_c0_g1_i1.p1 TRINITY_DN8784_c0_g1~~TRINITY_DN8784_c0_g1_i1.p1  ORF type:complete len:487 (+),score=212.95 TRINITY_DN8784_c0_g1_i1:50-1462(+)
MICCIGLILAALACAHGVPLDKINFASGSLRAGAVKLDGTLPIGVPLAGYNHGARRVPYWPVPVFGNYTTWMTGNKGALNPTWVKGLAIDDGTTQFVFVTIDGIGSAGDLNFMAWSIAGTMGLTLPYENILFSASHSHSGPGAVSSDFLWSVAPATDLLVPSAQRALATTMAKAIVQSLAALQPAALAVGSAMLVNVTENRRAGISPFVKKDTIDPHLGVIRVDTAAGKPIATLWNYAIHGVCYGPDNMYFSSDIMGAACDYVDSNVGGVTLFVNADAGDIDPSGPTCAGAPSFHGAPIIGEAIAKARSSLTPSSSVTLATNSVYVPFGPTNLNYTLGRFNNCTTGGALDICTICAAIKCDANVHMPEAWLENTPRFTALRIDVGLTKAVIVSAPGEALLELGWWVRNDTAALGFDVTLFAGYSNNHMGYFCTPNEYDIGGYESQLTLWGINTAVMVRNGMKAAASAVKP